ncbi:Uu.00g111570.m01.CDS01 [Anthostomella pinea]|uniref:Uu.00g111570.m01.CDS01 n=1 Tax=Anthostomella pinea TaxID=933095 RepID=A0AAI8YGC9_9PEZI|nr:Uu.00g111570.m01.CDS01 [Anthostomella pinea]
MAAPASMPGGLPAYEAYLWTVDWNTTNYRAIQHAIPWGSFHTSTVSCLANVWHNFRLRAYNSVGGDETAIRIMYPEGDTDLARQESIRRHGAADADAAVRLAGNPPSIPDYIFAAIRPDATTVDNPADRSNNYEEPGVASPVASGEESGEEPEEGGSFFTAAVGWEMLIAVCLANPALDPAKDDINADDRWMTRELLLSDETNLYYRNAGKRAITKFVNVDTAVVAQLRDEAEDSADAINHMNRLADLAAGRVPYNDFAMSSAPTLMTARVNHFFEYAERRFFKKATHRRFHECSDEDIEQYIKDVIIECLFNDTDRFFGIVYPDLTIFQSRLRERLQVKVYEETRDSLAEELPGGRRRDLTWSVHHANPMSIDVVRVNEYVNIPTVTNSTGAVIPAVLLPPPTNVYRWYKGKIASPVVRILQAKDFAVEVEQVTSALRKNFRIHKDLPSINATTQITIGHSDGFSLLDLKRFVTLCVLGRHELAGICKFHRSSLTSERVCGQLTAVSKLGAQTFMGPSQLPNPSAFPHPSSETRAFFDAQMKAHVPYSTIDALCAALAPHNPQVRANIEFRVSGGRRTPKDQQPCYVEWRRPQADLEPLHIVSYLMVFASVVQTAMSHDAAEFRKRVTNVLLGGGFMIEMDVAQVWQSTFISNLSNDGFFAPPNSSVDYNISSYPT